MKHLDLFSGIGGFALAADRVFGNVEHIFCDNDLFCQEVLKKHWPNSKIYGDIRTITNTEYRGFREGGEFGGLEEVQGGKSHNALPIAERDTSSRRPFLLTGGFPCQPFSQAGKRKGTEDERHLWPEMLRVIQLTQPEWVIAENVRGLLTQQGGVVFEQVCLDLEAAGYEVQPIIIPAVAVNAPHRRDRVWFVANRKSEQTHPTKPGRLHTESCVSNTGSDNTSDTKSLNEKRWAERQGKTQFRRSDWSKNWLEVATRLCRVDDGLPKRLDRNPRLKALGNAIVPQVAEEIMKAINTKSSLSIINN